MRFEVPLSMIRSLKGAPLSILVVMAMHAKPVDEQWLCAQTGYTDKTLNPALEYLKESNLVTQHGKKRGPWSLTARGQQLPFVMPFLPEGASENQPEEPISETDVPAENDRVLPEMIDIIPKESSENIPVNSENFRINDKKQEQFGEFPNSPSSSSRSLNLDSREENLLLPLDDPEKFRIEIIDVLLDRAKIRHPAKTRLLRGDYQPHVVRFHISHSESPGQAIHRIEKQWPLITRKDDRQFDRDQEAADLWQTIHLVICPHLSVEERALLDQIQPYDWEQPILSIILDVQFIPAWKDVNLWSRIREPAGRILVCVTGLDDASIQTLVNYPDESEEEHS